MDETKKTAPRASEGGEKRSRSRRGRRDGGRGKQPAQGGQNPQQQPKFDPHFLTGAETAVLPAKTVAGSGEKPRTAIQPQNPNGRSGKGNAQNARPQREKQAEGRKEDKESRSNRNASKGNEARSAEQRTARGEKENRPAAQPKASAPKNAPADHGAGRSQNSRNNSGRAQASSQPKGRGSRSHESRSDDPGLVLISRRPPQQKFSSFEEYMEAHGGATAPIEDHSQDY